MKTAIIGCGSIASVHAECIKRIGESKLAAFVDTKQIRAEEYVKKYGGKAFGSLDEMLENERVDTVHICTPHYLHAPMAVKCLNEGLNVFVEKPTVIDYEQWIELKKTDKKGRLGFCFQNRYNPCVKKALEMIESGVTGRILGIRGYMTWSRDEKYYTESDWRGSLMMEGGGALINQAVHTLDLIDYIMGKKAISIDAVTANHHLKGIIEVEDAISAYIKYHDASASFYASTDYIDNPPPIIEVHCENMRLRIEGMDLTIFTKEGRETMTIDAPGGIGKSWWGTGHEDCIRDYYKCISGGSRFINDIDGVEDITMLMLGAYKSAGCKNTVMLTDDMLL